MKHPFNGRVRFYYVYNHSEFKQVSVCLKKLKRPFVSAQRHDLSSYMRLAL